MSRTFEFSHLQELIINEMLQKGCMRLLVINHQINQPQTIPQLVKIRSSNRKSCANKPRTCKQNVIAQIFHLRTNSYFVIFKSLRNIRRICLLTNFTSIMIFRSVLLHKYFSFYFDDSRGRVAGRQPRGWRGCRAGNIVSFFIYFPYRRSHINYALIRHIAFSRVSSSGES